MSGIPSNLEITTREMQTCGTPVRIVEDGMPKIPGRNILEKLEHFEKNFDYIRKFIVYEPRGHHVMAVLRVEPDRSDADIAVIFAEKEGYVPMCGEAVISLGRYCVDNDIVEPTEPETLVRIQCPCGLVPTYVSYKNGRSGSARFRSVPSFVFALDVEIAYNGIHSLTVDVAYGGGYYAIVSAKSLNINFDDKGSLKQASAAGRAITEAVKRKIVLDHPDGKALALLNGTLVCDITELSTRNIVRQLPVFRDNEGRGPCGSGTSAHIAVLHARGKLALNESATFLSAMSGTGFQAKAVEIRSCGKFEAVTVNVSGKGYYTGKNILTAEDDDALSNGFIGM